jgi:hypothetical protein
MRRLGLAMIIAGALATIPAMFLPYTEFASQSLNWWKWFNGFDIALLVSCVLATGLALAALVARHPQVPRLAGIAAGVTFGFTFGSIPGAIDIREGIKTSIWIIGGTGAVALAGAVLVAISKTD